MTIEYPQTRCPAMHLTIPDTQCTKEAGHEPGHAWPVTLPRRVGRCDECGHEKEDHSVIDRHMPCQVLKCRCVDYDPEVSPPAPKPRRAVVLVCSPDVADEVSCLIASVLTMNGYRCGDPAVIEWPPEGKVSWL